MSPSNVRQSNTAHFSDLAAFHIIRGLGTVLGAKKRLSVTGKAYGSTSASSARNGSSRGILRMPRNYKNARYALARRPIVGMRGKWLFRLGKY